MSNRYSDVVHWREAIGRSLCKIDFRCEPDVPFYANIVPIFHHSDVRLVRMTFSAGVSFRDEALVADDNYGFSFAIARTQVVVGSRGDSRCLRPGEATLIPLSEPAFVGSEKAFGLVASLTDVVQLSERGIDGSALLRKVWSRDTEALRLLRAYVRCLEVNRLLDGGPLTGNVSEHILDLIASTCRGPERLGDSTCSAIRGGRLAAILSYIAQHFHDPDLTIEAAASANGISVRYLQLMFKDLDTSFSEKINEQRLLYARSLLANPEFPKLHVLDVALRSGFSDVSYFNRRFKLRFGLSPNGLRSEIALTSRDR